MQHDFFPKMSLDPSTDQSVNESLRSRDPSHFRIKYIIAHHLKMSGRNEEVIPFALSMAS